MLKQVNYCFNLLHNFKREVEIATLAFCCANSLLTCLAKVHKLQDTWKNYQTIVCCPYYSILSIILFGHGLATTLDNVGRKTLSIQGSKENLSQVWCGILCESPYLVSSVLSRFFSLGTLSLGFLVN